MENSNSSMLYWESQGIVESSNVFLSVFLFASFYFKQGMFLEVSF